MILSRRLIERAMKVGTGIPGAREGARGSGIHERGKTAPNSSKKSMELNDHITKA